MKQLFSICILSLLALTIACGGASVSPTPPPTTTPIVYPSTFTPTPPETPLPTMTPTATVLPPTRTPDADTQNVTAALVRTARIAAYRIRLTVSVVDPFSTPAGIKPDEPFDALRLDGRLNQTNSEWHISGQEAVAMGGDAAKGFDLLTVGGTLFIKGPASRLGALQELWYASSLPVDTPQNQYPQLLLNKFADTVTMFPTMHSVQQETLDGKPCIKYESNEAEMTAYISTLLAMPPPPQGRTRRNTLFVSVCDDGYVHQWEWYSELADASRPDVKGTSNTVMQLSEIKILVPLQPPPDAIPAQNAVPVPAPSLFPFPKPTATS